MMPSVDLSLLPFSHSTKTEAQPSSLVLAVSSDTLSVGASDSIPAIFRKSFTAWEAFAALPPTPRKNKRPPWSRTAASKSAIFSRVSGSIFWTISAVSAKCWEL